MLIYSAKFMVIRNIACALLWLSLMVHFIGCGGLPLKEPEAVIEQVRHSAGIRPGESNREDVHQALGPPTIQSKFWAFEIYEASDKVKELALALLMPFWLYETEYEGYVFITYDPRGNVSKISVDQIEDNGSYGSTDYLAIRNDDLLLGRENSGRYKRGLWLMADPKLLKNYTDLKRGSDTCTAVVAYQESVHQKYAYEACPNSIVIDDAGAIDLRPFYSFCGYANKCPEGVSKSNGEIVIPFMYPIRLSPGAHRLVITDTTFKGQYETGFECDAGDVVYVDVSGYVDWHWWGPSKSTLNTVVNFKKTMPKEWSDHWILLYQGNRWIIEQEPDNK